MVANGSKRNPDATLYRFCQEREIPLRFCPVNKGRPDHGNTQVAVLGRGLEANLGGRLRYLYRPRGVRASVSLNGRRPSLLLPCTPTVPTKAN